MQTSEAGKKQVAEVRVATVEPKTYKKEQLNELIEDLYAVHRKIFAGVSVQRDAFVHYVFFPTAKYTKIHLFKNAQGELVGYFSLHHFEKVITHKKVIVLRGEAGILPEYRRHHNVIAVIIKESIVNKLLYLFREVYVLACVVHPVMYYSLAKNAYRIYPSHRYQTPRPVNALMFELADEFHLKKTSEANPFVWDIGWISKESDVDRRRLQNSRKKEIQFYLEQNPHYGKGYGLEVFIPLSLSNSLLTSYNFMVSHFGLAWRLHAKS